MVKDMSLESKNLDYNQKLIRSFGRVKSRKLSNHKNSLLENFYESYKISEIDNTNSKNFLEIGFGFGDFIFGKAKQNPDANFYGCEPHLNGIVNLLSMLKKEPLSNLKITNQDVRIFIDNFSDNFFEKIFILFPDPWPKYKHFKRRLIDKNFLDQILFPKLKNTGKIIIATDHDSYKTWILSHISQSSKFNWLANSKKSWQNFPNDWIITKYQKKAILEGREPIIIEIEKS